MPERFFEDGHVSAEISIGHPGDAVNGDEGDDARAEYLAVADVLRLDVAGQEDGGADEQHDHLDDGGHRDRFRFRVRGGGEMRQQIRESCQEPR